MCKRCGKKFADQRWEETTMHDGLEGRGTYPCAATAMLATSPARKPPAEAARLQAAMPPEPEHDQEPGKLRGLFRCRG
ncbi:hypothetical protein [Streptomyces prasinus]